jgi:hypothetical protein
MDALLMMTDLWDMVLNGIVEKWYFFVAFVALVILANKRKPHKHRNAKMPFGGGNQGIKPLNTTSGHQHLVSAFAASL